MATALGLRHADDLFRDLASDQLRLQRVALFLA